MRHFSYVRVHDIADAVREHAGDDTQFLAGGTNLVDLMKHDVEQPARVVDINALALRDITECKGGGLRLGSLATNAETAYDPRVIARYPILSSAILAGASAQLRNAATNGGNLNQRTRCAYFYDVNTACNKRQPGSGCSAMGGYTRVNAILGASSHCIATHPSDMCVALAVLEPEVRVTGAGGDRIIPFSEYHRLPGDEPWRDNTLQPDELVTAIDLPASGYAENCAYLKLRDRESYAFALVSVAVAMRLEGKRIAEARIALGGVAHRPWRVPAAERLLLGRPADEAAFGEAANAVLSGAVGQGDNDFKIDLAHRAIRRACAQAAASTPQPTTDERIA